MSPVRGALYALFVLVATVAITWVSITPLAPWFALGTAPACLARALVPTHWIPWLRPHTA